MNPDASPSPATNPIYPQPSSGHFGSQAAPVKPISYDPLENVPAQIAAAEQPVPSNPQVVNQQFAPASDMFAPATSNTTNLRDLANAQPVAVVKTLSTRGLEYLFMSICLWIGAAGLIWSLLSLVNGQTSAQILAFPATSLVVCVPIFTWFFIRLKRAELADPKLRFDPSKRRTSQITQVIAFLTSLFNVITFVYLLIASTAGSSTVSIGKSILNLLVILLVAGGILAYYWIDEHRSLNN